METDPIIQVNRFSRGHLGRGAHQLEWFKKLYEVSEADFAKANILLFTGGTLNPSSNCPDRYLTEELQGRRRQKKNTGSFFVKKVSFPLHCPHCRAT